MLNLTSSDLLVDPVCHIAEDSNPAACRGLLVLGWDLPVVQISADLVPINRLSVGDSATGENLYDVNTSLGRGATTGTGILLARIYLSGTSLSWLVFM